MDVCTRQIGPSFYNGRLLQKNRIDSLLHARNPFLTCSTLLTEKKALQSRSRLDGSWYLPRIPFWNYNRSNYLSNGGFTAEIKAAREKELNECFTVVSPLFPVRVNPNVVGRNGFNTSYLPLMYILFSCGSSCIANKIVCVTHLIVRNRFYRQQLMYFWD